MAVSKGVNHFDVAPTYGDAELKLKLGLENHRDKVFLACKTQKRKEEEASEELEESMHRMRVDYIDLYQFHALDDLKELKTAFGPNGALQAMLIFPSSLSSIFRALSRVGLDHQTPRRRRTTTNRERQPR